MVMLQGENRETQEKRAISVHGDNEFHLLFERERPNPQNSLVCLVPKQNVTCNLRTVVNYQKTMIFSDHSDLSQ